MTNVNQSLLLLSTKKFESECIVHQTKKNKIIKESKICLLQLAASVTASLGGLGMGAAAIWSSPALPYLKSNESKIRVTGDQGSWIAALFNIGGIIGYLLYPFLVDRIGRKYSLLTFFVPQITSWTLIYFAKNVEILYIARISSGIGYSAGFAVQIMYISEIADKNIRGTLVLIGMIFYCIGALTTITAGAFLSYHNMNLILILISLLFVVNFTFLPESPYFYLKKGRYDDAFKTLSKLRSNKNPDIIKIEINKIKEYIIENQIDGEHALYKLFKTKRYRKAFFIVVIAQASVSFSGLTSINAFSQEILSYSGFNLAPKYAAIVLTFVTSFFIFISAPSVDCFGRRTYTLFSGIMGSLSLGIVGICFFFINHPEIMDLSSISWLPLVALIICEIAGGRGLIPIAVILSAELFSIEVKSIAFCCSSITQELLNFLTQLGFDRTVGFIGIHGIFWTYAFFCFILPLINFCIMPETKGKTLEEIQMLLD